MGRQLKNLWICLPRMDYMLQVDWYDWWQQQINHWIRTYFWWDFCWSYHWVWKHIGIFCVLVRNESFMFDDNQIIGSNVFGASIFGYYWMYLDWRRRNRKVREAKIGKSEGQCLNDHTFRTAYWIFVLLVALQRASKVVYNTYFN